MNKPLLSVCLITYNQAQYIKEAVDSILIQRVSFPWELIIADDCSTDGTKEILLEYKKKHPDLIKLILQKKNVGPEKNWLDLIAYPRSRYVLYAEGDDYFSDPTKLQKQVDFMEAHHSFSICFHPVKVIYEDGSRPDRIFPTPEERFNKTVLGPKDLLVKNFIQTGSAMYRWRFIGENIKDVFPKNIAPGDWLLHILHAQAGKIGFINKTMAVYRRHPGGLWWNSDKNMNEIWKNYGLSHLRLYAELLKLYGDDAGYQKIIYKHMNKMFINLINADTKYSDRLLKKAMAEFPDNAENFIVDQYRQLQEKIKAAEDLKQSNQRQDLLLQQKDLLVQRRENEIVMIKSSRFWKLRNKVARIVGKEVI